MADSDHAMRALRIFNDFVPRIEAIAEESAATEAVLYRKGLSDEERARMTFEYELGREIECWEAIRRKIDERLADQRGLIEGQVVRRRGDVPE